jgi:carboxyl-terminal processing protease
MSALGVVLAAALVYLGSARRDQVDLGATVRPSASLTGLRADRSNEVDIPIAEYFQLLSQKLKDEYVEPVKDDQKLASGAIRGMVSSLGDPKSVFMEPEEFRAFEGRRKGVYEGIGVALALELEKPLPTRVVASAAGERGATNPEDVLPRLVVSTVVPGSPADRAGVRVGDEPVFIDGLWVIDAKELEAFRALSRKVALKQAPESELMEMRRKLRPRLEKSLPALRAKDKLVLGKTGTVQVTWRRGTQTLETSIEKGEFRLPGSQIEGAVARYRFDEAGEDVLRRVSAQGGKWTLDLRSNPEPDPSRLATAIDRLAPKGTIVKILGREDKEIGKIEAAKGPEKPLELTVLVDASTRGAASQLAAILRSSGAKVEGDLKVEPYVIETKAVGDGSGYTLATGKLALDAPKGGKS